MPRILRSAGMHQKSGYSAQAMPELAVKIKIAPTSNRTTMTGTSHHFFSCRENFRNSLSSDHMGCCIRNIGLVALLAREIANGEECLSEVRSAELQLSAKMGKYGR